MNIHKLLPRLICGLFYHTVSISSYRVSHGRMTGGKLESIWMEVDHGVTDVLS